MKDNNAYLKHILDAISLIEKFYSEYGESDISQAAIERQLEIIGEASNNLAPKIRSNNPQVPWRDMINMRNILIHNYMGVNVKTIWDTVTEDLPELKKQITAILSKGE